MNRTSVSIAIAAVLMMMVSVAIPLSISDNDLAAEASDLPSSYDLRDYGLVTSVKDQGNHNTCWAFSVISCAETNIIKKGYSDQSIDLSEYQLAYYMTHYTQGPIGGMEGDAVYLYDGQIINGNRCDFAAQEALQWRGLVHESDLRYENISDSTTINPVFEFDKTAYIVTSVRMIAVDDTESIKRELLDHNSLFTAIPYIKSAFKIVTDDNGKDSLTFYASEDKKEGYHAMTVVGYDDNYPRENFAEDPGCDGAWLIKNSFGTTVFEGNVMRGYDGYVWVSYASVPSFEPHMMCVEVEPASTFDKNYQYDGGSQSETLGTDSPEVSSANIFKAVDNGAIRNISFYAAPENYVDFGYSVRIYTGLTDPNDPCSGTLAAGPISGTGYFGAVNVDLGTDVAISKGELFSVVITTDTVATATHEPYTKMCPIAYDADLYEDRGFIIQTCEKPGQSFMDQGDGWKDLCDVGNLRIKAYVCDDRAITGIVNDKDGNPVSSATISFISDDITYTVPGGSDGKYALTIPSGEYSVMVGKEGYCTYHAYDVRINDDRTMNVVLESPTSSYTLSVECGEGGSTDMDGYSVHDKNNAVEIVIEPADGKKVSRIEVNGSGYPVSDRIEIAGTEGSYSVKITFEDATYSISGCVVDILENVLSGVTVTVEYAEGGKVSAVSGSDGRYVLEGLGYGRYTMTAVRDGYTSQIMDAIDLKADVERNVIMFSDGTFATVNVSSNDGGTVSPGTSLFRIGYDVSFTIIPDEMYVIGYVKLDGKELGPVDHVDIASISGDHTLEVIFERQEFVLTCNIEAFTFDVDYKDILVEIRSDTYYAAIYTDESGRFSLKVPFGTYQITAKREGMVTYTSDAVVDSDTVKIIFYEPRDYIVRGNVYDQNGNMIDKAKILVDGESMSESIADGRFTAHMGHGTHTITVVKDGYSPMEFTLFVERSISDRTVILYRMYSMDTGCTGGTITGSGSVRFNDSFTVTYEPADGYVLSAITVDGSDVSIADHPVSYTFENIADDHTISVTFVPGEFTVRFLDYDGTMISEKVYTYGSEIVVPEDPVREDDDIHSYRFTGWSPEVSSICASDATYTATYTSVKKDGMPSNMEIVAIAGIAILTIGLLAVFARGRS